MRNIVPPFTRRTNKKPFIFGVIAVLLLAFLGAGCASKTTTADSDYDRANALRKEGRINDALPYYTEVILKDRNLSHKATAYYYRGYCNEELQDFGSAYRDYLASQLVACHIDRQDLPSRGSSRGKLMYSLCADLAPESAREMRAKISKELADWAEGAVRKALPADYFTD